MPATATDGIINIHKHGGAVRSSEAIMGAQFTHDGLWAAATTSAGPVNFFSMTDHSKTALYNPLGLAEGALALTCFRSGVTHKTAEVKGNSETAYFCASMTSMGTVQLHDVVPGGPSTTTAVVHEEGNEGLVVSFSNDDKLLASAGSDKVIRLYDTSEGLSKIHEFTTGIDRHGQDTLGHPNRIFAIKWINEFTFLSGGWESSVLLHDIREKHAVRAFENTHITGDGIDFIHDAVVTASERTHDQLQVFDFGTGKLIGKPITMNTMLYSIKAVERKGQLFGWTCGNKENALYCVSLPSGKIVESYTDVDQDLFAVDVSPKSNSIIVGGADNVTFTANWIVEG